jgi:hypothetical protein
VALMKDVKGAEAHYLFHAAFEKQGHYKFYQNDINQRGINFAMAKKEKQPKGPKYISQAEIAENITWTQRVTLEKIVLDAIPKGRHPATELSLASYLSSYLDRQHSEEETRLNDYASYPLLQIALGMLERNGKIIREFDVKRGETTYRRSPYAKGQQ